MKRKPQLTLITNDNPIDLSMLRLGVKTVKNHYTKYIFIYTIGLIFGALCGWLIMFGSLVLLGGIL